MKVNVKPEYRAGSTYPLVLEEVHQFADKQYGSDDLQPKFRFVLNGEFGRQTIMTNVDVENGEPAIRPSSPTGRILAALGVDWDNVESLEIVPTQAKLAKIYGDKWQDFPRLGDTKQEGFQPITVSISYNGAQLVGNTLNAKFAQSGRFIEAVEFTPAE